MKVMKRIHIIIFAFVLLHTAGCSKFLDRIYYQPAGERCHPSYTYARNRVTAVYSMLKAGFDEIDGAMIASAGDEAEHTLETSSIQQFNTGDWDAFSNPGNVWDIITRYPAGQSVPGYKRPGESGLPEEQSCPAGNTTHILPSLHVGKRSGFLRAYFHFELLKRYGGVPIVTRVYALDDDASDLKRNTFGEVVQFIVNECDAIAPELPVVTADADLGRVTRGAALALKSRVLLYAASDLYNNTGWAGGYTNPEYIAMPDGDRKARWQAAADAAKTVIDVRANYALAKTTRYSSPPKLQ